jgi:hypothetical protein
MRIFGRAALCVMVMLGATGALFQCSDDETSGGEDPPTTVNDVVELTSTTTTAIPVLNNDTDLDNEPLTFAIEDSPTVGSASFNSDRTVRLDLPTGFRGATRFRYRVTNSLGGFSIATAVVFVDIEAYRIAFAAQDSNQNFEIYLSNLASADRISNATQGSLRLRNMWLADETGPRPPAARSLLVYERADPSQAASSSELFYVRLNPVADPVRVPRPSSRTFIADAFVAVSPDNNWIAFPTTPTSNTANSLYALDTSSSSNSPQLVDFSSNLVTDSVQWGGDQPSLYYFSQPPGLSGRVLYRADTGAFNAPTRLSPPYSTQDTNPVVRVSPDKSRVVLLGTRSGGLNGAFLIESTDVNRERRLTTDMPAGAIIESFDINEAFTELTYLWRTPSSVTAQLSAVPIDSSGTNPRRLFNADVASVTELRPDEAATLVTRSPAGFGNDGTLFEVLLDGSGVDERIATNVTGGFYDDTGDNVFLFSRTLTPSVIARGDFGRTPTALVRTSTPQNALYVTPATARSVAIIEDPTSGLVVVNATSPGNTIRLTTLNVGSLPSRTLFPTAVGAP